MMSRPMNGPTPTPVGRTGSSTSGSPAHSTKPTPTSLVSWWINSTAAAPTLPVEFGPPWTVQTPAAARLRPSRSPLLHRSRATTLPVAPYSIHSPLGPSPPSLNSSTTVPATRATPVNRSRDSPPDSIALIDRGSCTFRDKVLNAQTVGAAGVIVVNNQGNDVIEMGGDLT